MRSLTYKQITWHDDPDPSEEVLHGLKERFGFHELDIEDCLSEHERPKVEEYDDYLFLVFHIPFKAKRTGRIVKEEVNIFVGQDFIITLHQGRIPLLENLWNGMQESESLQKEYLEHGTGFFLYELMNNFFENLFPMVDGITREIRRKEDELFESEEQFDLLRDIMILKRNIISARSILLPQRSLIGLLEHKNKKFVSEELGLYFDDILDKIERQWSLLETAKEMVDALQDTQESALTHKTNSVIRVLTIFSVVMLPLTFFTGLYGMNISLPYQENPQAFYGILFCMFLVLGSMIWYFARKKWL